VLPALQHCLWRVEEINQGLPLRVQMA